jgi:hypothetical protein
MHKFELFVSVYIYNSTDAKNHTEIYVYIYLAIY